MSVKKKQEIKFFLKRFLIKRIFLLHFLKKLQLFYTLILNAMRGSEWIVLIIIIIIFTNVKSRSIINLKSFVLFSSQNDILFNENIIFILTLQLN